MDLTKTWPMFPPVSWPNQLFNHMRKATNESCKINSNHGAFCKFEKRIKALNEKMQSGGSAGNRRKVHVASLLVH